MKYFAYGSNMCTVRLRERVPSCEFCAVATLTGYTLKFHKRSTDGSGKCNALQTNHNDDQVIGVVFEIANAEKPQLDRAEGLGHGYHEINVSVVSGDITLIASMYVADHDYIDDALLPYSWYRDFVVNGAYEHNLTLAYIRQIENVITQDDLDKKRDAKNRKLLPPKQN